MLVPGTASAAFDRLSRRFDRRPARPLVAVLVALACAGVATALVASAPHALNPDATTFLVVGRGLTRGDLPYRDLFDHKPPLIYLIMAAAYAVGGGGNPIAVVQTASIGAIAVTGFATGLVARHLSGSERLFAAAAIVTSALCATPKLLAGGGLTETFALAALSVALALLICRPREGSRPVGPAVHAALAGIALGVAAGCSLLAVGAAPAMLVALSAGRPRRGIARDLIAMTGGLALVGVAVIGWLAVLGLVPDAWAAVAGYSTLYRSSAIFDPARWIASALFFAGLWLPATIALASRRRGGMLGVLALAWLGGEAIALLAGIRMTTHYLVLFGPPMALLAAAGAMCLPSMRGRRGVYSTGGYLTVVGLAVLFASTTPWRMPSTTSDNAQTAAYLHDRLVSDQTVYVWGHDCDIYLDSGAEPPGRYFYQLPLLTPGLARDAVAEELRAWEAAPPAYVVDASFFTPNHPALAPLLVDHGIDADDGRILSSELDPLRRFVAERYRLVAQFGDERIYVLQP